MFIERLKIELNPNHLFCDCYRFGCWLYGYYMWERAAISFWRLGKRFKNSGKGIDRKNHKNEGTGTTKHIENKPTEDAVLRVTILSLKERLQEI